MITETTDYAKKSSNEIELETCNILSKLGVRDTTNGYLYIKNAILKLSSNYEYLEYLSKGLYPDIGKDFNRTWCCIERSMRHAIKTMNCSNDIKIKYIGYAKSSYTNKEFLACVFEYILLH